MFFKKKKKKEPEKTGIENTDSSIYLDIGAEKIKLALIDNNKKDKDKNVSYKEATVSLDETENADDFYGEKWEDAAKNAIDELLDAPEHEGVPVHFTRRSGKKLFLRTLPKKSENINKKDVTSLAPVPLHDLYFHAISSYNGEETSALIGITSGEFITGSLHLFGKHKRKVVSFVPSSLSFVNFYKEILKNQEKETDKQAGLFLDIGFSGTLFLTVSPDGQLYERNIDIGFFQIAQKLLEKRGLDFQTASEMLIEENVLDPRRKEDYQAVDETVSQLALQIKKSISYFSTDKTVAAIHKTLYIGGGACRLKGLDKYLNEKLGLEIKFISTLKEGADEANSEFDTLSGLLISPGPQEINLLQNSGDLEIKFDNEEMEFSFEKYRFIKKVKRPIETDSDSEREEGAEKPVEPSRYRGRPGAHRRKKTKPSINLDFLMNFFQGRKKKEVQKQEVELTEEEAAAKRQEKVVAVAILFFILFFGYRGYANIEKLEKKRTNLAASYLEKQKKLDGLVKEIMAGSGVQGELASESSIDKNFWVEKLIYVAKEMTSKIWLSSINLEKGGGEEQQKLVINGFVIKSTDGHLQVVSEFMKRLSANENFMRDFSNITFDGIHMGEGTEKVTFRLICWYQRNIHPPKKSKENIKNKIENLKIVSDILQANEERIDNLDQIEKRVKGKK